MGRYVAERIWCGRDGGDFLRRHGLYFAREIAKIALPLHLSAAPWSNPDPGRAAAGGVTRPVPL